MPVYTNITGEPLTTADWPAHFVRQMTHPVRWQSCVENMKNDGVDLFVEVGAGKTLSGFMKRIDRSADMRSTDSLEGLLKVIQQ